MVSNFLGDKETEYSHDRDIGFWVRLSPDGDWVGVRSLLPLSVFPKFLETDFIAVEVVMKNGKKHAIFRGLATIVNDSDIKLDVSVCHSSSVSSSGRSNINVVIDEIFENQCYHPISGWGNKGPSFRSNDPGRWSTRDFSYSSNVCICLKSDNIFFKIVYFQNIDCMFHLTCVLF